MLEAIIAASLRNRAAVLLLAALIAVIGLVRAVWMPIDVLPSLDRPVVTILADAHGLAAEDVERIVTRPLERALLGAPGVHRVRSISSSGLAVVYVEFDWGTDLYLDRQIVTEKLQLAAAELPPGLQPELAPVSSIMGQVQLVGLRSPDGAIDGAALRRLVDRDLRPRLLSLPGVAQVVAIGGAPSELQVVVDAERMQACDVTLPQIAAAVEQANLDVTGGLVPAGPRALAVRVPGRLRTPEELASAVVRADTAPPVRLQDVADVQLGPALIRVGAAGIDGGPGVIVAITKQVGSDTIALTDHVDAELARFQAEVGPGIEVIDELFRQADFIDRAIENVLAAVRDGALLVVLILFLFLFELRTTLITLTAMPLSIAATALVFAAFGMSINTMTLGGLAVAIGMLVDDAIVDVENVWRRLHENAARAEPRPAREIVYAASCEVRRPVLYGTLLVTVVYLPLFFLTGLEGRLFTPIGVAYVVSVAASLLVALTVTPVLCLLLLGRAAQRPGEYGNRFVGWLKRRARPVLQLSVDQPLACLAGAVVLVAASALVLSTRGSSFLPEFDEGSAQVNLFLPPGTSLETADAIGQRQEQVLRDIRGIRHVARRTGRAEGDEHVMPVETIETIVTFDPEQPRPREELVEEIRARMAFWFPGVATATEQPLAHLLSHLLSGVAAQVAIKIEGPDLVRLRELAAQVSTAVAPVAGVRDLVVEPQVAVEAIDVVPDRAALARLGIPVAQLGATAELALGGRETGRFQDGELTVPVRVLLEAPDRADATAIGRLQLETADGTRVRIADVADVRTGIADHEVRRENGRRRIVVQHNVGGRSLGEVVADVERVLAPIRGSLTGSPGYSIRLAGQFEAQQQAERTILGLGLVALLAMFAVLQAHFRSFGLAAILLLTRPFALVGSVLLVVLTGQVISVATWIGFIALLGIAARNGVLLFDHYLHLLREEREGFDARMVVRGSLERLVPVLMTALTSGAGLVPILWAGHQPGRELLYPIATVVVGGLVTGTLLDYLVTPGLFLRFGRAAALRSVGEAAIRRTDSASSATP